MANKCSGFIVRSFQRPSGAAGWLVSGTMQGKQRRREFGSRDDALSYAEEQNSLLRGSEPDQSPRLTRLSIGELRDAENVSAALLARHPGVGVNDLFKYYEALSPHIEPAGAPEVSAASLRLKQKFPDMSVARAVDHFATTYRPPKSAITLEIAIENYICDVVRRRKNDELSLSQEASISKEMTRLEKYFGPTRLVPEIMTSDLQEYLRITTGDGKMAFSSKTWNNRRGYLTSFWKYCIDENWMDDNAARGIKKFPKKKANKEPDVLRTPEAKRLMEYLENNHEGRLVPFFMLCLFGGIRPDWQRGEISRLRDDDIDHKQGIIRLPSARTKTGRTRQVKMEDNLRRWLEAYPLDKCPIVCTNFKKLLIKVRTDFKLRHDVLRHTYCSMLVGKHRSVGDAALQAGNSETVIWSNYLNIIPESEAEEFWEIYPQKEAKA